MRLVFLALSIFLIGCVSTGSEVYENISEIPEENDTEEAVTENESACVCDDTDSPVCGEDGNTYPNACEAACAGIQVAGQGSCIVNVTVEADECNDTDGEDIYEKGTVTAFGKTFTDVCEGLDVKEYSCEGGEAAVSVHDCPTDFICKDGMCLKARQTCFDTDGGNDIYQRGTVDIRSLIKGKYIDKCLSATRLKEYYCQDDELVIRDLECPGECMEGHCVK
jgi:hypothetical protein